MNNFHLVRCQKNLEGGMFERISMKEQEFLYLNLAVIWIWSKKVSRRIFHSQVIKVKLGVSRSLGSHGGFPLAGHVTTEPERQWFPCVQPPWLSLSCVCLCFPSTEPSIFPLSIFSPGTLDHLGIQSWTEVSGTVWCTPGFTLRSVSFWRWFQRMGCAPFWGWPPSQVA